MKVLTKELHIRIPNSLYLQLVRLAKNNNLELSSYARAILAEEIQRQRLKDKKC